MSQACTVSAADAGITAAAVEIGRLGRNVGKGRTAEGDPASAAVALTETSNAASKVFIVVFPKFQAAKTILPSRKRCVPPADN
jgi:hypothetical protein